MVTTALTQFHSLIYRDSNRTRFVEGQIVLPEKTLQLLQPGNFPSDTYLFEAAITTDSKIIVTTDFKLVKQMQQDDIFKVVLLTDFLQTY